MAKRWEQITTKCLHHLNDLGLLAAITLIDSSVLAQTSRLQPSPLFLTAFLHRRNKEHLAKRLNVPLEFFLSDVQHLICSCLVISREADYTGQVGHFCQDKCIKDAESLNLNPTLLLLGLCV